MSWRFLGGVFGSESRGQPRQLFMPALGPRGFYRMAYVEWGDPDNPRVLVCVHGQFRNGRDFDYLARALAGTHRVLCPDMPGRGESDWWNEKVDYVNPNYVPACAALVARAGVERVDFLGTSMGGVIGMLMAAQPSAPIARLVVNDVGPFVAKAGLERIGSYVGRDPRYNDLAEVEAAFRKVATSFGPLGDDHWRHLAAISVKPDGAGKLRQHYDQALALPYKSGPLDDVSFWPVWDAITCPTLVLRGAESDLLTRETAEEMTRRGPKAGLVEIPGCGHAPSLMQESQIAVVRDWLNKSV